MEGRVCCGDAILVKVASLWLEQQLKVGFCLAGECLVGMQCLWPKMGMSPWSGCQSGLRQEPQ